MKDLIVVIGAGSIGQALATTLVEELLQLDLLQVGRLTAACRFGDLAPPAAPT